MSEPTETVLQFGAGRFLRAFIDRFIQHANETGQTKDSVVVVQSTPGSRADLLNEHPEGYHVLVRGFEDGKVVERVDRVSCIRRGLTAANDWQEVLRIARSPQLRLVVTNATESGYNTDPGDKVDSNPPNSLPAKLTQVLWRRFEAGGPPLIMLPCELIDRNAIKLLELIITQAKQWSLPAAFEPWVRERCWWLPNLVDCIVTRAPTDHPLTAKDPQLICAEPYRLLAIERPKNGMPKLFEHPDVHVVDDLTPYYLRKVRILNGLHTAMATKYVPQGFEIVQQVMEDPAASRWIRDILFEEIVPTIAYRVYGVAQFADQTLDRFRNPFSNHKLSDIMLNHADKIKIRLQTTREEYEKLFGKAPKRLAQLLGEGIKK